MTRRGRIWLLVGGALVMLLIAALGVAALVAGPGVRPHSLLVLELSGELEEEPPASPLERLLEGRHDTLLGMRSMLRSAAADPRVSALLVRIGGLEVGLGKADELREQIHRFQESGKPAAALIEFGGTLDYYVASACKRVYLVPEGMLALRGVLSDVPYLRGLLDKLHIQPDFIAVGRYKTAPEIFTRGDMSPAQREVVGSILDQVYARLRDGIAAARGLEPKQVGQLIDRALFRGASAVDAGLADGALYEDQLVEQLGKEIDARLTRLPHRLYRRRVNADQRGARVAVVYATGEIQGGRGEHGPAGGRILGSDRLAEALREVREDAAVQGVVLRIDSPGGMSTAADVIWREVALTREAKPVVVSMSDTAASGGYWIAAPASRVVAEPMTLTGSIGVFVGKFNLQGLYRWAGVNREITKRGANADLFSDAGGFTPRQRAQVQREMEGVYREFVSRVASGRGLAPAAVEAIAQGRVWTGTQARERGLVDELGGFDVALSEVRRLANIPPEAPLRLEYYPRERGLLESLAAGDLARAGRAVSRLASWLEAASRLLEGTAIESRYPGPLPAAR